jgi:hypothetical protein
MTIVYNTAFTVPFRAHMKYSIANQQLKKSVRSLCSHFNVVSNFIETSD